MTGNISVIGSGYVGLITGMGLAKFGNDVTFIDIDERKVSNINNNKPPIYEEGLEELMLEFKDNYRATLELHDAIMNSDLTFITVGTPSSDDGSIDLTYIKEAAKGIGEVLKTKDARHVIIVKSTVIPGTTENVVKPIIEEYSGKKANEDFGLGMNPEFLREGIALQDFLNPDRIVVGAGDETTISLMQEIYEPFNVPKLYTAPTTAEMIKYTANGFLATKISYANEIGNICKQLGIDTYQVFEGVGLDHRISSYAFRAGAGFGGSCFPKDVKALIRKGEDSGVPPRILQSTILVNVQQPLKLISLLRKYVPDLDGKTIGVGGLAFKPNSDDIRESPAIVIVEELLKLGANVIGYDPLATENFKELFPDITYTATVNEFLDMTDTIIIQTEWEEFEKADFTGKIVIDGRRVKAAEMTAKIYEGICW